MNFFGNPVTGRATLISTSTSDFRTVRVELAERSYDIQIGRGTMQGIAPFITERVPTTHVVIITDSNVDELIADRVAEILSAEEIEVDVMVIDAGEESKTPETAWNLWEEMLAQGADRQSTVVAVGGGVVGDLAGFIAATFTRGLPFFQLPTTLLAQVDSSVGGKVGVNLSSSKNMVGAFWQPRGVLVDVDVLNSLPAREYSAGLAEVIKYGVIMDATFFDFLEKHVAEIQNRSSEILIQIVERCCQLKARIVQEDEREETGRRAILNYGHTFGHALEAAGEYKDLLHGEAIAIGMLCASRLAERRGTLSREATLRQEKLITALGLPARVPDYPIEEVVKLMWHDKKVQDGALRFVLPCEIGRVELVKGVRNEEICTALTNVV